MRVFDFDGTIYDGESLFDLYLYSARHDPKVFRYIAPVLRYAVKYKLGRATLEQMEYGVGKMTEGYLTELSRSKRVASVEQLVDDFWDRYYARIKPWYQPESDDVILTASFGLTVGEVCRRLGVRNLVASEVDVETMKVTYLNFNTNKTKRFRELYGPDAVIDEFYTDSKFDQPMIDMARHAFMVKGNTITQVK
ncbi:MAG: haloacid dehalogenase-like hydrolase [Bifidobacterium sp.]